MDCICRLIYMRTEIKTLSPIFPPQMSRDNPWDLLARSSRVLESPVVSRISRNEISRTTSPVSSVSVAQVYILTV